jgi:hypothetical protein
MTSKPRLKRGISGDLTVIATADSTQSVLLARGLIKAHYGSLGHFAQVFKLPYGAVCEATNPKKERLSARRAGNVALVRRILGLRSEPTALATSIADAIARKQGART